MAEMSKHDKGAEVSASEWQSVFLGLYAVSDNPEEGCPGERQAVNALLARVDALCAKGPYLSGQSALHRLAECQVVPMEWVCVEAIGRMRAGGLDVDELDAKGMTALMAASICGRPQVVQGLLAHGANMECVDPSGRTALLCAAYMGNEACVQALLDHGASVTATNKEGRASWEVARRQGHGALAERLLAWAESAEVAAVAGPAGGPPRAGESHGKPRI